MYPGDIVDNGLLKGAGPKLQTWPRNETVEIEVRNVHSELLLDYLTSFLLSLLAQKAALAQLVKSQVLCQ